MAAGVPIRSMVAGISCGLVTGETDDDYLVLTDIQGLEDFFGDMDFKVGGTHKGITAIQMDIKIHGLTRQIIEEAIRRCREARLYIMDNVMAPVDVYKRQEFPVLKSPKGRAAQMNDGAARASGEIVWFVHCDSRLPEDAHSQIQAAAESGAAWGCFHIGFDYDGPFMGCNTFFSNRRARQGIAFGDQGIWIRRELFLSLGGFPELPIMEDYEFSLRMKERGIPIRFLPGRIIT